MSSNLSQTGAVNCLPLSAELIFNRNGAALFAQSAGAG
jgi:hypothetical protein